MNIQGVDPGSYQTLIASIIECHELIRRFAAKKDRRQLLEFLPSAAVNSYLFGAQRAGRVVSVAIGGPTDKPRGLFNFKPDGTRLFVYYTLIHPDLQKNYREVKRLMFSMMRQGLDTYPDVETVCYFRGSVFHETTRRSWERAILWAAQAPERSDTHATAQWQSSSDPTKALSRDSRSPQSSTGAFDPRSYVTRPSEDPSSSSSSSLGRLQPGLVGEPLAEDAEAELVPVHSPPTF